MLEHSFSNIPTSPETPHDILALLSSMQSQLDQLVSIVDARVGKQSHLPQKLKLISEMRTKHQGYIEREIISNNQKIIRMLEEQKLQCEIVERIRKNQDEIRMIEEEKRKLEMREQMVGFERLRVEQQKKELRWRQNELNRKESRKENRSKMRGEVEAMRRRVRENLGVVDETTVNDSSESSLLIELNEQMNRIRREEQEESKSNRCIIATVDGRASTRESAKNTPSIEAVKEMSLLSPLSMVLSINDSRKYPFSEESSIVYNPYDL